MLLYTNLILYHGPAYFQELIAKDIEASDLDFSRYGETFFEVIAA